MIRIEIKGPALDAIKRLAEKTSNLSAPMRKAGSYMERETKLNFAKQSDPDGAPWAPLAASTLRRKKSGAILRETGALAGSITMTASSNQATVAVGTNYAIYHQSGTSKMPARKMIGINEGKHVPKIREIFEDYFSG